jgi:predicted NAD/FAD-dependent oxidoreductase
MPIATFLFLTFFLNHNFSMNSVLVIGAGIAGLTAARALHTQGKSVVVLDKGRAVGGRLTTRSFRIEGFGEAIGDRGAQFCTATNPRFIAFTEELMNAGVLREWASPDAKNSAFPRLIGSQGMVSIARHLAQGLDVRVDQKIVHLSYADGLWTARAEEEMTVQAEAIILTAPVPQSLALVQSSGIALPKQTLIALERIKYNPCIALMTLLADDSALTSESATMHGDTLRWIADNKRKGISSLPVLTIHAAPEFSHKHWDESDEKIADDMIQIAKPFIGSQVLMYKVHRWRYSEPVVTHSEPCLRVDGNDGGEGGHPPLVFAGDAFVEGRVEGAYLSGLAAAEALM